MNLKSKESPQYLYQNISDFKWKFKTAKSLQADSICINILDFLPQAEKSPNPLLSYPVNFFNLENIICIPFQFENSIFCLLVKFSLLQSAILIKFSNSDQLLTAMNGLSFTEKEFELGLGFENGEFKCFSNFITLNIWLEKISFISFNDLN